MKITKFVHSCLLVEMPAPVNRTVLFDPGSMSAPALDVDQLEYLDDIVITHSHGDHIDMDLIKRLVAKFPQVRITATQEVVDILSQEGITASTTPPEGMALFDSPHEAVEPMFPTPEQIGVHYLDMLSHPGDSHSFNETKPILALPVTAPWGATVKAVNLALQLKPRYIIPIHDWHWNDDARANMYAGMAKVFADQGITFLKPETGVPMVVEL
ncbi:MAG TPA: MBL fold metallo-hydrolase [Candidatus Saccharimonadales bacterium]|nr:MBL fold metallo-hydrolase [Candidatus Saccharimonadales bacterium]